MHSYKTRSARNGLPGYNLVRFGRKSIIHSTTLDLDENLAWLTQKTKEPESNKGLSTNNFHHTKRILSVKQPPLPTPYVLNRLYQDE